MPGVSGGPNSYGVRLFQFRKTGYDLGAPAISEVPEVAKQGFRGSVLEWKAKPLPMPDTSGVMQTGKVVPVTPENYARSFVDASRTGGIGGGQALFIHPQTGKWVRFAELPVGADGLRQSLGQQDGNPYVNRRGTIEVAHEKQESPWVEFRNSAVPVLAAAAPIAAAAALPVAAASAAAPSAATAGTTAASTAASAAPEIGAGLFSGGAEAAAAGSGGYLGGGGGALGFGGTTGATALPGFTAPTIGGAQVAGTSGGLSGIMNWLGSPTGQAVSSLGRSALEAFTARQAGQAQAGAAQAGIDEQRRQFEAMRAGLSPFQQAGTAALGGFAPYQQAGAQAFQQQQALAGLQGQPAQQAAISALEQSPLYQSLARQGEEALLQRASATGGLRGGNVQAALAQFRPAMLQHLIEQQYSRLGGLAGTGLGVSEYLTRMGQSSAALQGQSGMQAGTNIGNLLANQGQAQAGGIVGIGRGLAQALNIPGEMAGQQRAQEQAQMMRQIFGMQ